MKKNNRVIAGTILGAIIWSLFGWIVGGIARFISLFFRLGDVDQISFVILGAIGGAIGGAIVETLRKSEKEKNIICENWLPFGGGQSIYAR